MRSTPGHRRLTCGRVKTVLLMCAALLRGDVRRRQGRCLVGDSRVGRSAAEMPALLARVEQIAREETIYINVAVGERFARNQTYLIGPQGERLWVHDKNYPVSLLEPVEPRSSPVSASLPLSTG